MNAVTRRGATEFSRHQPPLRLPRLGIVVVENDPVPEMELWRLAPSLASVHTVRFQLPRREGEVYRGAGVVRLYREALLDRALGMLRRLQVDGVCLCYSHANVSSNDGFEVAFVEEAQRRVGCGMVTTATQALFALLHRRQIKAPLVLLPPWYTSAAVNNSLSRFAEHGFNVSHGITFVLPDLWNTASANDRHEGGSVWDVKASAIYAQLKHALSQQGRHPDSVVIPDCGFPSLDAVKCIESELGTPVISANHACLDWFLEAAASRDALCG